MIVVASLGDRQFSARLEEIERRLLQGAIEVPIPPPSTRGSIELRHVWVTGSHDASVTLATWDLRLESLSAASGREYLVLNKSVRAQRPALNIATRLGRGYRITVRAQSGVNPGTLTIQLRLPPNNQLAGNDGSFGWPTSPALARAWWSNRKEHR